MTSLDLQYVSPKLLAARDLELAIPGMHMCMYVCLCVCVCVCVCVLLAARDLELAIPGMHVVCVCVCVCMCVCVCVIIYLNMYLYLCIHTTSPTLLAEKATRSWPIMMRTHLHLCTHAHTNKQGSIGQVPRSYQSNRFVRLLQ